MLTLVTTQTVQRLIVEHLVGVAFYDISVEYVVKCSVIENEYEYAGWSLGQECLFPPPLPIIDQLKCFKWKKWLHMMK